MATTQVRAELRLDDLASATLSKLQAGFGKLDGVVSGATRHMFDFAKQTAAVAVGVNLGNIFGNIKGLSTSAFNEAVRADDQMKMLTRTMAGLSAVRGRDMLAFRRDAEAVRDKLTEISRKSGVAREALVDAFGKAGANTRRTGDQLTTLIGRAAGASRAMGVPVQEVVGGFMELEKNVVSASNPIVAMVKQANLMRGHSEQIALKFSHMSRFAKERLAEKAFVAMAAKAKEIPLTFTEMSQQLGDMRTDMLRLVGDPIAQKLGPIFERFTKFVGDNRAAIEQYARVMGEQAGVWIMDAARAAQDGFRYLQTHAEEIRAAIQRGFDHAKTVFQWMIDHKELIAGAFVAGKVGPGAVSTGAGVYTFGKGLVDVARNGLPALGIAASAAAAGLTGVAVTLGAFTLAVGGAVAAGYQLQQLFKDQRVAKESDQSARAEFLTRFAEGYTKVTEEEQQEFERIAMAYKLSARGSQETAQKAIDDVEKAKLQRARMVQATGGVQRAASIAANIDTSAGISVEAQFAAADKQNEAARAVGDSLLSAANNNQAAAVRASIDIIRGSEKLQKALRDSGSLSADELQKLGELLGNKVGSLGKDLLDRAGLQRRAEEQATGQKGAVPLNVFNGGQTFQIKQDFRDQDPDRIAFIFQRDLATAAENRIMAGTAGAYGT